MFLIVRTLQISPSFQMADNGMEILLALLIITHNIDHHSS